MVSGTGVAVIGRLMADHNSFQRYRYGTWSVVLCSRDTACCATRFRGRLSFYVDNFQRKNPFLNRRAQQKVNRKEPRLNILAIFEDMNTKNI